MKRLVIGAVLINKPQSGDARMKKRKRMLERLKNVKRHDWRQHYYWALNAYVMSRIMEKSRYCQREFGKYMILLSVGMRYGYGYTFARLRWDIRRRTDLWKSALRIGDPHALDLRKFVDEMDAIYSRYDDWKFPLRERGYEGLTIYQPVFPSDIEHQKEMRRMSKNRYKSFMSRRKKAKKLKRNRKKNWKMYMPKT